MATAKLLAANRNENGAVLSIEINDAPYIYSVDVCISEAEIISVNTWAAFWTNILKPKLDVIIARRRAMNTRIDAIDAKIGQEITV